MTAPRTPCPEWCVTDHARFEAHWAQKTAIGPFRGRPHDEVSARLADAGTADGPAVLVDGVREGQPGEAPYEWLGSGMALFTARLIEMLATASPAQHRELAKGLREAAAVIAAMDEPQGPAAEEGGTET